MIFCQVCQLDIGHMDVSTRERHVNECIDEQALSNTDTNDEIDKTSPTIISLSKFKIFRKDPLTIEIRNSQANVDNNTSICHICKKDLHKLDVEWKTKHINVCIDKASNISY